jgi:hypothetical protein
MSRKTSCIAAESPSNGLGAAQGNTGSEKLLLTLFITRFLLIAFV